MDDVDPEPEVSTLLYIGRRGRITNRAIGLTDCILSLLQQIDLAIVQIRPPWFALISMFVDV